MFWATYLKLIAGLLPFFDELSPKDLFVGDVPNLGATRTIEFTGSWSGLRLTTCSYWLLRLLLLALLLVFYAFSPKFQVHFIHLLLFLFLLLLKIFGTLIFPSQLAFSNIFHNLSFPDLSQVLLNRNSLLLCHFVKKCLNSSWGFYLQIG